VCQDDTCEIISLSDHPFKIYDQKSKCSIYVYHRMRRIRFRVKVSHGIRLRNTMHWCVVPQHVYVSQMHLQQVSSKISTYKGMLKTLVALNLA